MRKRAKRADTSASPPPPAAPPLRPDGAPARPVITAPSPLARPEDDQCAVGAKLIVPASVYPTYDCDEHGGWGWSATVLAR
eukprot:3520485-Pleurochrysis_carterae.AAC.1